VSLRADGQRVGLNCFTAFSPGGHTEFSEGRISAILAIRGHRWVDNVLDPRITTDTDDNDERSRKSTEQTSSSMKSTATSCSPEATNGGSGVPGLDSTALTASGTDADDVVVGVSLVDILLRDERHSIQQLDCQRRWLVETPSEFESHSTS
jgi:hypothetical protein